MKKSRAKRSDAVRRAREVFQRRGGVLRTCEAIRAGIHPRTLYGMRDEGQIEPLAKGLYRLADAPVPRNPDLLTVARKAPEAVVCLLSALAFHDLTTQVPHAVYVALPTGSRAPRLEHPPLEVFEFGGEAFSAGIQTHDLDGVPVRVYSPEKTLADCFKYRNRIGLEVAVEALRLYVERRAVRAEDIMRFARICRVARVMRPYLEATL